MLISENDELTLAEFQSLLKSVQREMAEAVTVAKSQGKAMLDKVGELVRGINVELVIEDLLVLVGKLIIAGVVVAVIGLILVLIVFKLFELFSILVMES